MLLIVSTFALSSYSNTYDQLWDQYILSTPFFEFNSPLSSVSWTYTIHLYLNTFPFRGSGVVNYAISSIWIYLLQVQIDLTL